MTWMVLGLMGAIFTGFVGIAYSAGLGAELMEDSDETVFILFTQVLFNPWVSGFLLAAILAAIMSTIDSQLLVSSSAITEDFYKAILRKNASEKELVWVGRLGVVAIAIVAIILAQTPESTVLELVAYAWGGFGAAFGPVIILSLFWKRMTRNGALAGMLVGALTVIIWADLLEKWFGITADTHSIFGLYEIVPGFILGWIAIMVVSLIDQEPSQEIQDEFERARTSEI